MLRMTKEQFGDAVAVLQKNGHPGDDENVRRVCVAAILVIRQRRGLDPKLRELFFGHAQHDFPPDYSREIMDTATP